MAGCLVRAASPRCHDCRDIHAPLLADLVEGKARVLRLAQPEPGAELQKAA
jgi:hypothetical protein